MNEPLDLWIKAGSDGSSMGGDPISHELFMILLLKSENPKCRFNIRTLNEAKPPAEFKSVGLRHAPALVHDGDIALDLLDEIIEYIDKNYAEPSLRYDSSDADNATADLFRAFCFYIKEVNKDPKNLLNELYRLDRFLETYKHNFLVSNRLTYIDCRILTKLHSIRIAGRALKEFEIPIDLYNLWGYLKNGYEHDAFRKSCPSDQEIILYWADRKDTLNLTAQKRAQLCRQKPLYTLFVPKSSGNTTEDENTSI